mgnify:CR=1 FL=1
MEFNIAICDDEMEICSQVENILVEILKELAIKFEIDVFNNGKIVFGINGDLLCFPFAL